MSALRLLILLAASIFFGELAIMFTLEYFTIDDSIARNALDATALVIIVFPVLYFFLLRAVILNAKNLTAAQPQLLAERKTLKQKISERTKKITIANEELKHSVERLRSTKKFIDTVIENIPLPIIVKDVTGLEADAHDSKLTLFNRAYEELTGDARIQMLGKTAHQVYSKERADLIVQADNEALQSDQAVYTSEHPIATAHNGTRLVISKKSIIRDENDKPQYLLTVVDDVTERRRNEQQILYMAHYDALTDLPNRTNFKGTIDATLDCAAAAGRQFALLSLDLDHFKEANDTYGHIVGDALLREVGHRLQAVAEGAFIARIGGDEFMLIVDGAQPATAAAVAERMLATFVDDFEAAGHRIKLGLSIGCAIYPTDGTDAITLIARADRCPLSRQGHIPWGSAVLQA